MNKDLPKFVFGRFKYLQDFPLQAEFFHICVKQRKYVTNNLIGLEIKCHMIEKTTVVLCSAWT